MSSDEDGASGGHIRVEYLLKVDHPKRITVFVH